MQNSFRIFSKYIIIFYVKLRFLCETNDFTKNSCFYNPKKNICLNLIIILFIETTKLYKRYLYVDIIDKDIKIFNLL